MPSLMNSFFRVNGKEQSVLYDVAGTYSFAAPAGTYKIVCRGAGGAGGTSGTNGNYGTGGSGGAGGKGKLQVYNVTLPATTMLYITVGAFGTGAGAIGGVTNHNTGNGGNGGNAGHASFVFDGASYYGANGGAGGGGGGGGGTNIQGRYNGGAGSGAGGQYFRWNGDGTETLVSGQNGVNGNGGLNAIGGVNGNTTDFPTIKAGIGARGSNYEASGNNANGGTGAGASGGAGGGANWNTDYSTGGGGGGGAGGDDDAGGGQGGGGWNAGGNATNYHSTPTDVSVENALYRASAYSGRGGATGEDGNDGFVYIERLL